MKLFGFILSLALSLTLSAQTDITGQVSEAMKTGKAVMLSKHLDQQVDLAIPGKEGTFAAAEAFKHLDNFFRSNRPTAFRIMHKGTSKLNDQYRIGDLITSSGTYRVTFFMHQSNGIMRVKQLRIEAFEADDF